MHKVFISYHHKNDQDYKEHLVNKYGQGDDQVFINRSVDTGDISDGLPPETIRAKIRDEYLRDTTVLIVLVGTETKNRKHIDWEIYSSMYNGEVNKRCGILAITLPSIENNLSTAPHGSEEKEIVHPNVGLDNWHSAGNREEQRLRYPFMPDRILDNLPEDVNAKISVVPWEKINKQTLEKLIELAHNDRENCEYDMSRDLMRSNR